jgi:spore maturation protein CgeB
MRIQIVGPILPDSFARNIAVAAEQMGHTVLVARKRLAHRWLNQYWIRTLDIIRDLRPVERRSHSNLVREAESFRPDLIMVTCALLPPEVITRLKSATGAKVVFWYSDPVANLGRQYPLGSQFDAWFFKEPYMAETFRAKLGINAHYLPEACTPRWHHRVVLSESDRRKYGCDLTTAGNLYYYKARILEAFKDYDIKIWGVGYPRWLASSLRDRWPGVFVAELEKAKAFNATKIVLNPMIYAEIEGVNDRLFQAAGCGAFQITDMKRSLPQLFEPEREIVTFQTLQELKEKVDYFLANSRERAEIGDRAYARAHRDHTYQRRLGRMFEVLGFASEAGSVVRESAPIGWQRD